jgi:hypothetical protein
MDEFLSLILISYLILSRDESIILESGHQRAWVQSKKKIQPLTGD